MLNSQPLNSGPLNSLATTSTTGPDPVELAPGGSFAWTVAVSVGGTDVSDILTGGIKVDRSEDGDSVATFALWLGLEPVNVIAYTGLPVVIDFIVAGDPAVIDRRFTGYLVQPEFNVLSRVLSCEATTRLQDGVEAMEIAAVDTFVGGLWSEDVFEPVEGRSRWDYAQERLSTRAASLNADRYGAPRITDWHSAAVAYEFKPGSTIHESIDIGLASLSETTNVIELELDYRFTRYRQRNQRYSWEHPGIGGNRSIDGFTAWRSNSTELPDIAMIVEATESAGWYLTAPTWFRLPGDLPDLPQPWYNKNTDLLLAADWTASIRWSQRAVEQYRIRLEVADAVAAVGEVIKRERVVLDTDTDADRLWEAGRASQIDENPTDVPVDVPQRDSARLQAAMDCALARGRAQLLAAQRQNLVSWQVPLAHALGVDIGQKLRLNDQGATATGMVTTLVDEIDIESGAAILTIGLSVSPGSATSDALVMPPAPSFFDVTGPSVPGALPTQIGLRSDSPLYDEELPGFAGSYSIGNGDPALRYPRRMMINTPEIPEQWRDEIQAERAMTYRIAPPTDTLEI
ncbi:hypothetical protein SAMN05216421_1114 [Halopseudomonas xinjiangensis]|uniref:Phage tail protein n=1 Tax=Halopseudomonas xinjiangensis TaxID=487184 RepID=A0A1H1QDW9_9GAMM|nr:hypothetical protein [Halopseudomonas xinjiangensis]SDS21574.1 hypothetical protein SAMN05216421_1114 [Halopseudomonas xinjiangensis]